MHSNEKFQHFLQFEHIGFAGKKENPIYKKSKSVMTWGTVIISSDPRHLELGILTPLPLRPMYISIFLSLFRKICS